MKLLKFFIPFQLMLMKSPIADGRINEEVKGETTGGHSPSFHDAVVRHNERELADVCNVQTCFGFGQRSSWTLNSPCTDELKEQTCQIAKQRAQNEANQACSSTGACSCVGNMTEVKCELIPEGNYCRYKAHYSLNGDCESHNPDQCVESSCLGVGTSTLESPDECTTVKLQEVCEQADEAARLDSAKDCTQNAAGNCTCADGNIIRKTCEDTDVTGIYNPHTKCIYVGVSVYNGTCS